MSVLIVGLLLGGTYALIAMGLQLQYGVARVMNLAYGEVIVAGALPRSGSSPPRRRPVPVDHRRRAGGLRGELGGLPGPDPAAGARAETRSRLDVDSILATFGLSFIFIGILLTVFGGEMLTYSYLARPFVILGEPYALNRIAAFLGSAMLCASTAGCIGPAPGFRCARSPSTQAPPRW